MLDHWICKTALAWGWEQERFLFDEDFEEEIAKLRVALFPELCELSHMTPEEREAHEMALEDDAELDELIEVVDWDDDEMNEKMNNWYVTYGKWQTKSFVQSDVKTWDEEDVTELDEWIKSSCLMRSALVGYSEESITDIVLAERHSLFPRLNPEEVKDAPSHDVLPSLSHVRRLVLAHSKIDDVPFILPEDGDYEDDEEGEPISLKRTEADNMTSIDRDAPYQSLPGLSALRSLEARGKALGSDEDNEEEDYYDEEEKEGGDSENAEKEFDEEVAAEFEALQLEIEKKEEKLMHKALREEKWREREAVLELTEEEIEEEWKIQQKQRALAFALPELAKFDTKEFRKRYMTKGGHRNDLKK
jgi:hypothetical protein